MNSIEEHLLVLLRCYCVHSLRGFAIAKGDKGNTSELHILTVRTIVGICFVVSLWITDCCELLWIIFAALALLIFYGCETY